MMYIYIYIYIYIYLLFIFCLFYFFLLFIAQCYAIMWFFTYTRFNLTSILSTQVMQTIVYF